MSVVEGPTLQNDPPGYLSAAGPRLPATACLPINRCNLPASILGGLTFQERPAPLMIDGVASLHADLFRRLDALATPAARAAQFADYMAVHFCLENPVQAGAQPDCSRTRATWQRLLRGWLFDSDSREGAVLKGWVESRFGLLPRYHRGPIRDFSGATYRRYLEDRAAGLYNTNALEAQLDLVFTYAQYELEKRNASHWRLYRGFNGAEVLASRETLTADESRTSEDTLATAEALSLRARARPAPADVLLLNNLNSFSRDPERASEFGDQVVEVQVPRDKILCHDRLFPGQLRGEGEFLVLGGLYRISRRLF